MLPLYFSSHESNPILPVYIARVRYANGMTKHILVRGDAYIGDAYIGAHKGAAFDHIYSETLRIHPTTREIAYVARKARHHVVVQNQQVSAPYDAVWFESLHFTPGGDALFFLAERDGKTVFVVNGMEQIGYTMALDVEARLLCDDGTASGLDVAVVVQEQLVWQRALPHRAPKENQAWTPFV